MPTEEKMSEKSGTSHVVKVTGMSAELLGLLDARVKQQQATGRAEYIRELIRRDTLASLNTTETREHRARRPKARRSSRASSEQRLLGEYHNLVDLELAGNLSASEQERLKEVTRALDRIDERTPETHMMLTRLEETAGKLDSLLAAVQALPKAEK